MTHKTNKSAALITGGAKRIGREIAIFLARKGYDIAINYNKSKADAQKLALEINQKFSVNCKIFSADLSNKDSAKKLVKEVIKVFPHLNLLVNNASIFRQSKFISAPESEMLENFNIHFFSPLILTKEFAKNIAAKKIKNAQIINMIDKNIVRFDTSYFYYLLSKKALADLTKMLALELAPQIRVNGVAPGFILNPIDNLEASAEKLRNALKKIPLQKKGDPKNILQAVEFLLKNDFVSGQILSIDGAASLNHAG
ncbi:MAG: SDR family oxidoreductase [Rickettsiales bacterium]|nr:SDR family oxidoreductase [Rickettsiales bacterium]